MSQKNKFSRVRIVGKEFGIQYGCFKAFSEYYDFMEGGVPITITNNFFDMALLNWVHLFGNQKDDLHFRNTLDDPESFKESLLSNLGITNSGWEENWRLLKGFRDQRVAHIDPIESTIVPKLDLAFESVCFYYDYVTERLREIGGQLLTIKSLKTEFAENRYYYEQSASVTINALNNL
ncbi:hypothetical protein Misp06_00788 [Microbulbifer sp. NBRC 101763]|uniref:hypothetical protein n=1 Tax=Microbulbifer sp. NBRC 101763 TaxID=1113820 RepID=UPI0030B0535D